MTTGTESMPLQTSAPRTGPSLVTRISHMGQLWWRFVMFAIALVAVGAFIVYDTMDTDHLEHYSVVALESGKRPNGKMVQVSGHPLNIVVEQARRRGVMPDTYYVPIVSVNWEWGDEVACIATMSKADFDAMVEADMDIIPVKGLASKHMRLDSEVKHLFEDIEPSITLASSYIVINEKSDPVVMRRTGISALGVGGVLLAIATALLYLADTDSEVDEHSGDRALRAAMGDTMSSRFAARAAKRDMSDCNDAVRQWCQSNGFSGYQER